MIEIAISIAFAYTVAEVWARPDRRLGWIRNFVLIVLAEILYGGFSFDTAAIFTFMLGAGMVIDGIEETLATRRDGDRFGDVWHWVAFRAGYFVLLWIALRAFPAPSYRSVWGEMLGPQYFDFLAVAAGIVALVWVGGDFMSRAIAPFAAQIGTDDSLEDPKDADEPDDDRSMGLKNAGRAIGQLERILIFLSVLMGSAAGVGFLVAAKSIMRFGELSSNRNRRLAEYIIIGTFMSFAYAVVVSLLVAVAVGAVDLTR